LEVAFPVLNFPSSADNTRRDFDFLPLNFCGLVLPSVMARTLFAHNPPAETPHTLFVHAPHATGTPGEKSREEAPIGIRFSARALTKNAFRFVKVRLVLAHKKASCQGRNPTFSR